MTNALYTAVVSGSATTSSSQYPATSHSYTEFSSFITKLNYATSLQFSIPTDAQWLYAAKGGNKSQGYTYSGSDIPSDVAWYEGNAGGNAHPVKQLAPNELGIYDMSGNVEELTTTMADNYYDYSYYRCGGNYNNASLRIKSTSKMYSETNNDSGISKSYIGLRVILTCK